MLDLDAPEFENNNEREKWIENVAIDILLEYFDNSENEPSVVFQTLAHKVLDKVEDTSTSISTLKWNNERTTTHGPVVQVRETTYYRLPHSQQITSGATKKSRNDYISRKADELQCCINKLLVGDVWCLTSILLLRNSLSVLIPMLWKILSMIWLFYVFCVEINRKVKTFLISRERFLLFFAQILICNTNGFQ